MYEIQKSFSSGEISPLAWLRDDVQAIAGSAVSKMRNVFADPHGPARSRQGFEFVQDLPGENYVRVFAFRVSISETYCIAISENKVYILDSNGFHLSANELVNGNFSRGDFGWQHSNALFSVGLVSLVATIGQDSWIRQLITVNSAVNTYQFRAIGYGDAGDNPYEIRISVQEGGQDILFEQAVGTNYIVDFVPGVTTFWVEVRVPPGEEARLFSSLAVREITGTGDFIEFDSPYTNSQISTLQVDMVPGRKDMILVTRGAEPHTLGYTDANTWSFEPIIFLFGDGDIAPWEDEFPGSITFHDGRMALGGTNSKPTTVWLSKPQLFTNFDFTSQGEPDDPMVLPLSKNGDIQWLRSNDVLFVGMDTGEHIINAVLVLQPNDAQTTQQSSYGSARIHAVVVDEQLIYVDPQGRTIRAMQYNDDQRIYKSNQISFLAEHITEGSIRELSYGISPIGIIYGPTFNGDLIAASIETDQGTLGWHRHTTQGFFLSTTVLSEFGQDLPWVSVVRDGVTYIERYTLDKTNYMDSSKIVSVITETNHFTGFEHLANKTVQVLADGAVHNDLVVAADGSITLDYFAKKVIAGLGYTAEIETLPAQFTGKSGNTLNHKKRYTELYVYLLDSPRPVVNGYDLFGRSPQTPMNTREANETGMVTFKNPAEWSREAIINIKQELPLGMIIAAVGGKLKENKI